MKEDEVSTEEHDLERQDEPRTIRISRREFLLGASAAAAGGILAACAPSVSPTAAPTAIPALPTVGSGPTASVAATAAARVPAGTLIVLDAEPIPAPTFDPAYNLDFASRSLEFNVMDPLVGPMPDGSLAPRLASEWKLIPEGIEMTLRKDVKFHDGQPCTADDVKYSIERSTNSSDPKALRARYLPEPIQVKVVDSTRVQLLTKYPLPVLTILDQFPIYCKSDSPESLEKKMNGTGPYKWAKLDSEVLYLAANMEYWGGPPALKEIRRAYAAEESTRVAALQNGECHVALGLSPDTVLTLEGDPNVGIEKVPSNVTLYLGFRAKSKVLGDNVALRQALSYAMDSKTLAESMFSGMATNPVAYMPPGVWPYNVEAADFPVFDLEKARAKLAEAGFPDGNGLPELVLLSAPHPLLKPIAEIYQATMGTLGVKIKLDMAPLAEIQEKMNDLDVDDLYIATTTCLADPDTLFRTYFKSPTRASGFSFPDLDAAIEKAVMERDQDARANAYAVELQTLMAEHCFMRPAVGMWNLTGVSKRVKGWSQTPLLRSDLFNVTVEG